MTWRSERVVELLGIAARTKTMPQELMLSPTGRTEDVCDVR